MEGIWSMRPESSSLHDAALQTGWGVSGCCDESDQRRRCMLCFPSRVLTRPSAKADTPGGETPNRRPTMVRDILFAHKTAGLVLRRQTDQRLWADQFEIFLSITGYGWS